MTKSNTGLLLSALTRSERERLAYITNDPDYAAMYGEQRDGGAPPPSTSALYAFFKRNPRLPTKPPLFP